MNHTLAVLHAAGAAAAARGIPVPARLFVPLSSPASRAERLRQLGGQVEASGSGEAEAEHDARAAAQREGAAFIDAFSDPQVSGGLGSIAIELLMQLPRGRLDAGEGGPRFFAMLQGARFALLPPLLAHMPPPRPPASCSVCAAGAQRWPAGGHCSGAQGG